MLEALLSESGACRERGDLLRAVALCMRAVRAAPNDPRPHSLLGRLALDAFNYTGARAAFANAAAAAPRDAGVLTNYGLALTYVGDFETARNQYRKALAIDAGFVSAYYNLANIAGSNEAEELTATLERLKREEGRSDLDLSLIGFALGKLYDLLGEWSLAFENYADGNRLSGARFDLGETLAFFKACKETFTADLISRRLGDGNLSNRPVFMIGMPRSGSSLAEELLARHPDVAGLGERNEIRRIVSTVGRNHPSTLGYPRCAPLLSGEELRNLGDQYLASVEPQARGAARIIDKQLPNFQHAPFIRMLFPNAAIIHCRRDAIDTCVSAFFQGFQNDFPYSFDLETLGRYFAAYADFMAHWEAVMPGAIIDLRYEDLVSDRDAALGRLFALLGLAPPTAAERDRPAERFIRTASVWQARQPIYSSSIKRWKRYERYLAPLFKALENAGYTYDGLG